MAHLDERGAEHFERARPSPPDRVVLLGRQRGARHLGELDNIGSHRNEKRVAQPRDHPLGEPADLGARADGISDRGKGEGRVTIGERVDEILDGRSVFGNRPGGDDLIERGQRVARRASPDVEHVFECSLGQLEAGVLHDVLDVLGQHVDRQQVELQMLGAAADRLLDLLRVGGREDEDDVGGRVFECLEERVRCALREHVDLVEDVHLAPARGAERGPLVQLADAVDAVVRRRVELEHVERRAVLDRPADVADTARLAVGDVRAVQGFGEDARGRRLAGAAWPAEEVRVRDPVVAHGVAEGPHHVLLTEHFVKSLRSVAAVEGLMVRHAGRLPAGFRPASRRVARLPLATRPPCQVAAGSCATAAREPSQGREAAALSGSCCVPQIAWPSP